MLYVFYCCHIFHSPEKMLNRFAIQPTAVRYLKVGCFTDRYAMTNQTDSFPHIKPHITLLTQRAQELVDHPRRSLIVIIMKSCRRELLTKFGRT